MFEVRQDFTLIQYNTPMEFDSIDIYCIADLHIGSPAFNNTLWERFKALLKEPNAYVIYAGDLIDNALKTSKSNVYGQTMSPHEQKRFLANELYDHRDKIIAILPGNHETRSSKDSDAFPIYDVACKLDIEDRYRQNMGILDIGVGQRPGTAKRQYHYFGCVMHKTNKTIRYHYADTVDGIDFHISAHTHNPADMPRDKIQVDPHNKQASVRPVETIVTGSFMGYKDYPVEMALRPSAQKFYKLVLDGRKKRIETVGFRL